MTGLLHDWSAWMWGVTWQVALLVAAIWLVDRALRGRGWAGLRLALWTLVFVKLVLPASLASPIGVAAAVLPEQAIASPQAAPTGVGTEATLFALWAIGILLIAIRSLRTRCDIRRVILATASPASRSIAALATRAAQRLGLRKTPRVMVSSAAHRSGAAVVGILRPVVIIPPQFLDADRAEEAEHVLLHEFAHIRRGDPWTAAAVKVLRTLFWFHPLVALAARRVNCLREICCDGAVTAVLGDRSESYRNTVLRAARELVDGRSPAPALAMAPEAAALIDRLRALEATSQTGAAQRRIVTTLVVLFTSACVMPMAPSVAEIDPLLMHARQTLRDVAAGNNDSGCLSARYAALYLAANSSTRKEGNTR